MQATTPKPNKIERLKAELKPYDFLSHIDRIDLGNLSEDERFYLKNFGIYNHKLSPETFMLRVRITAGRITVGQLKEIAAIAEAYRLSLLITMRAQIELHGLDADTIVEVWKRIASFGLNSWQTLTDNFRNIVTDPLDGEGSSNLIPCYPLIKQMESLFLKNPNYVGMLPRKVNTAISGATQSSHSFFSSDIYFALAKKGEDIGFNLYLGGKNSEMAQDADIFVQEKEAVSLFDAVAKSFMRYGLRSTRSRTRLFHLLQAEGMERFREQIQHFYPKTLQSAGNLLTRKGEAQEFFPMKNGRWAFCYSSRFGEISPKELLEICSYAEGKALSVRLGIDQNIYILGLKTPDTPFAKHSGLPKFHICAGSRYCPLSLFDMKDEAAMLPRERLVRLGVSLGYSGCLKGCGKHQHADIGLIGLRTAIYGPTQKSVRLFLGARYTDGSSTARLILMAVPLHSINDVIHAILDEFEESGYDDFETFSQKILNNYSTGFLGLWFLGKIYYKPERALQTITVGSKQSPSEEKEIIKSVFPKLPLSENDTYPFHKEIQYLSQKLWGE